MNDTEWFHGRGVDDKTIVPLWAWALVVGGVLWLVSGCATVKPQMPPAVPEKIVASFEAPHTQGTLYDERCDNPEVLKLVIAWLPPELVEKVKAARGTYEGKEYGVCWLWMPDESAAIVIWDDGGHFAVPRQLLKFPVGV